MLKSDAQAPNERVRAFSARLAGEPQESLREIGKECARAKRKMQGEGNILHLMTIITMIIVIKR